MEAARIVDIKGMVGVRIEAGWHDVLSPEFEKLYFSELVSFVRNAYRTSRVFPPGHQIFRAFDSCPFSKAKVVILGQDPYHEQGQAEGLAFSVPDGITPPPSLRNMLQEILNDTGKSSIIKGGNLQPWVEQGVLLLNSTLTVEAHRAASHQGHGWETFTDAAISALAQQREGLVFMLWGSYARRKAGLISSERHLVLEAPHPSPLSASRGFFGCQHFSRANNYLVEQGKIPIRW